MQRYSAYPPLGALLAGLSTTDAHVRPLALVQVGAGDGSWLWFGPALLALVVLLALGIRRWRRGGQTAYHPRPDPLLIFPISDGKPRQPASLAGPDPAPDGNETPLPPPHGMAGREVAQEVQLPPAAAISASPPPIENGAASRAAMPHVRREPAEPEQPAMPPPAHAESESDAELFDGRTVRYYRPVNGNLQLLPGRLEIVEGEDRGQDIRFVRLRNTVPEVTFGRSPGPPHRHVQLRARTVSREHARMNFEEDHWRIHNLSRTNPIVVNGQELHSTDEVLTLRDGDLIEMGEVVFRFHAQG